MSVLFSAVGDVLVDREDPSTAFAAVAPLFAESDVLFGNCEAVYSMTEDRFHDAIGKTMHDPSSFAAVRDARFDVMSSANNHTLDAGYRGMRDTLALLHGAGIQTVGAGEDLAEAGRVALVKAGALTIGFLGYTCVFPAGAGAGPGRPGMATIPVHSAYRGEPGQPGTRPVVLTFVDPDAKATVLDEVARAHEQCDVLVVSVHWGIHLLPAVLATYERELGRALVDAGADVVLGHHQHIIKGIEVYRGKPIFYGLGNFVLDHRHHGDVRRNSTSAFREFYGEYRAGPREGYPHFPFHPESRMTMIARLRYDEDGRLSRCAIRPAAIDPDGCPIPLAAGSPEFSDHLDYLRAISAQAGLASVFIADGDEIDVSAG